MRDYEALREALADQEVKLRQQRAVMQQALDRFEKLDKRSGHGNNRDVIAALKEVLR